LSEAGSSDRVLALAAERAAQTIAANARDPVPRTHVRLYMTSGGARKGSD
jgi:hypothetical protein